MNGKLYGKKWAEIDRLRRAMMQILETLGNAQGLIQEIDPADIPDPKLRGGLEAYDTILEGSRLGARSIIDTLDELAAVNAAIYEGVKYMATLSAWARYSEDREELLINRIAGEIVDYYGAVEEERPLDPLVVIAAIKNGLRFVRGEEEEEDPLTPHERARVEASTYHDRVRTLEESHSIDVEGFSCPRCGESEEIKARSVSIDPNADDLVCGACFYRFRPIWDESGGIMVGHHRLDDEGRVWPDEPDLET